MIASSLRATTRSGRRLVLPTSRFLWVMVHRFRHAVRRRATMLLWRAVYLGFFDMQWQRTWGKVSLTYPQTAPLLSYQCLSIVEAVLVAWEVRSLRHHPSCQSCLVHCCNRKPSHFVFFVSFSASHYLFTAHVQMILQEVLLFTRLFIGVWTTTQLACVQLGDGAAPSTVALRR